MVQQMPQEPEKSFIHLGPFTNTLCLDSIIKIIMNDAYCIVSGIYSSQKDSLGAKQSKTHIEMNPSVQANNSITASIRSLCIKILSALVSYFAAVQTISSSIAVIEKKNREISIPMYTSSSIMCCKTITSNYHKFND